MVLSNIIGQETLSKLIMPLLSQRGRCYEKWLMVKARKVEKRTQVTTTTSTGVETINFANPGDYIIQNLTEAKEEYVVHPRKFKKLYVQKLPKEDNEGFFVPLGKVMALEVTHEIIDILKGEDGFYILAPWGSTQKILPGDFLVCPPGQSELYGIAGKEFKETYRPGNEC